VTLTAHGIVGGAIVSLMPAHPILGLCLAFASHYLLDAIPHWDYPIRSASVDPKIGARMRYDRALLADAIAIGTDGILGVALPVVLFATRESFVLIACGACAAMLPDFAVDAGGGDLIALAAYLFRLTQGQAARKVADAIGIDAYE
jgi:hypothetical protein